MLDQGNNNELPPIPAKRYFTIGEVSDLCAVKPHVLRYWEQEFPALNPVKRRGNRRYYQRHDVLMIRQIRALLYDQGFTITVPRPGPSRFRRCAAPASSIMSIALSGNLRSPIYLADSSTAALMASSV